MTAFAEFGVMPEIVKAVEEMEWLLPSDVQQEAVPMILGGGDVLMAAETGSGKTGAFSLPVIQVVYESAREAQISTNGAAPKKKQKIKVGMNPTDREAMFAISDDGLLCQSREHAQWQGGRGNVGLIKGKHYFEALMTDEGLCRIGWSTLAATLNLGTDNQGYGFGGTGKKSFARSFDTYGETYGLNDVLGCYLDLDNFSIYYSKNGKDLGLAFSIPQNLQRAAFYPAATVKNAELQFNFGETPFKFPLMEGYAGVAASSPQQRAGVAEAGNEAGQRGPMAIILEPSKELAEQTYDQIGLFKKYLPQPGITTHLLIGGRNTKADIQALKQGVDIVVGTPGRIKEFQTNGKLDVSQCRFFVLDEFDGLLSAGHSQMIEGMYNVIPKKSVSGLRMQMIVCSATLHNPDVKRMADKLMHFPTWIDLKGRDSIPETVHHCYVAIDPRKDSWWHNPPKEAKTDGMHNNDKTGAGRTDAETMSHAIKILKYKYLVAAIDKHKMDQAIIFCRTKMDCDNVEQYLLARGGGARQMVNEYSCCCVHGDRKLPERRANLQSFKDGSVRFLVCTDVAARGIDVRGIPYVINFTLPDEKENYIHRIGRVGRADRMGLAISLTSVDKEKVWWCSCKGGLRNCHGNSMLATKGGCSIWYDEPMLLRDIEEHLGVTIPLVEGDMVVPVCEFDGVVTYGEKKSAVGTGHKGHADVLAPSVTELAKLEFAAQNNFWDTGSW